jgi:hypothetical protein
LEAGERVGKEEEKKEVTNWQSVSFVFPSTATNSPQQW